VDARRKAHGYNEEAEQKGHPVLMFLGKFWGVSAWRLELIIVLSAILGKYSDLAVVSALRQAEVGIAVSTAPDVAKGAASVVLTEPGLTGSVLVLDFCLRVCDGNSSLKGGTHGRHVGGVSLLSK
jgi:magnesium-transporting ATPase (P-type)